MDFRKWYDRYSTDCMLKYASEKTQENYRCSVGTFLKYFEKEVEPKSIPNQSIKEWLLTFTTINTRNHKICATNKYIIAMFKLRGVFLKGGTDVGIEYLYCTKN